MVGLAEWRRTDGDIIPELLCERKPGTTLRNFFGVALFLVPVAP